MAARAKAFLPGPLMPSPTISMAVPEPPTVGDLLKASMAAHNRARGVPLRPDNWLEHLKEAADLRRQAAECDPGFADPAWADEEKLTPRSHNTHQVLMAFYESKGL